MAIAATPTPQDIERFCDHAWSGQNRETAKYLKKFGALIVNERGDENFPAIISAVAATNEKRRRSEVQIKKTVQLLLDHGADINVRSKFGSTALWMATAHYRYQVMTWLIEKGADVNAADHEGVTPLLQAARHHHDAEAVDLLLKNGADINAQCNEGYTPAMYAMQYHHPDVLKALLDAGADLDLQDHKGRTVEMMALDARERGFKEFIALIEDCKKERADRALAERAADQHVLDQAHDQVAVVRTLNFKVKFKPKF